MNATKTLGSVPSIEQSYGRSIARAAARRNRALTTTSAGRRPRWLTYAILTAVLLLSVAPLYYTLLLGSADAQYISQHAIPSPVPRGELLRNIGRVLAADIRFWQAVANSIIVSVVTAVSVIFFSTMAGYSFAKLRFRGRGPLLAFVIATMAVPTQLGVIPLFMVMTKLGWQGQLQAVIVPGMVTAFGVFWMTQYLEAALPYELIEAARIDGCSMIRTFWHVALPASRPAAAMLGLFTFVGTWTAFFWPSIVLGSSNPTLPVATQLLQAQYFNDYSLIMAGVLMVTAPLVVVFIGAGRQLVSGIMQGAVKG